MKIKQEAAKNEKPTETQGETVTKGDISTVEKLFTSTKANLGMPFQSIKTEIKSTPIGAGKAADKEPQKAEVSAAIDDGVRKAFESGLKDFLLKSIDECKVIGGRTSWKCHRDGCGRVFVTKPALVSHYEKHFSELS